MVASWDEDSACASGTGHPPATGCGQPRAGDTRVLGSCPGKSPAPQGLQQLRAAAATFPALWKTPPSRRRLPMTQAASFPDGPRSPRAPAKRKPLCWARLTPPPCADLHHPKTQSPLSHGTGCAQGRGWRQPPMLPLGSGSCPGMLVRVAESARLWIALSCWEGRTDGWRLYN